MAYTGFLNENFTASGTTNFTTWSTTASTTIDVIQLGFQGFFQGIDYVKERVKEIFDDRAKIKQYRKSLFTTKVRQSSKTMKKQSYTVMIPPKRNFRGKEAQRK